MIKLRRVVALSKDAEIQQLARQVAQEVFMSDETQEAWDIVETVSPDLILLDSFSSPIQINEFLNRTRHHPINVPVVVVDSNNQNTNALPAELKGYGAEEFLRTSRDHRDLEQIVNRLKKKAETAESEFKDTPFFATDYAASVSMVGQSKAMLDTLKMIKLVAASRCNPILITGETGTGKELAAKAIHFLRHPDEQFVPVNCAALTVNLLESELFGHVKGSFTGADREKTGLLEMTGKGTIFLDEISEIPLGLQSKLLRVLQEKTFRKVGGLKSIPCNATIITSSNRNLKKQVQEHRFRRDLYYRLSICPINIPPLRLPTRREDIKLLAAFFLKTSNICPEKVDKIKSLTKLALEALEKHNWPGNVRELRNVIEKAIMLETTDKIGLNNIIIDSLENTEQSDNPFLHQQKQIKDFSLAKAECELITRALQETGWQKTRAAALLGITRATLYAKVRQYNIGKAPNFSGSCQTEKSMAENKPQVPASSSIQPVTVP